MQGSRNGAIIMSNLWWISNILTTTFEFYLFDDFMSNVLIKKTNVLNYKAPLYLISGAAIMIINTFQMPWLDIAMISVLYFLLLSILYKNSNFEKVFYTIAFLFPMAAIEAVVKITWFTVFRNITSIGFISINILGLLAAFLLEKIYLIFISKNYHKAYRKWFSCFLILPFIYMFVLIEILTPAFNTTTKAAFPSVITGYALLFANTVSFYLFDKLIQNLDENKKQSLYIQSLSMNENYYRMVEKNNENQALILHDFKHHIHTITAMARSEKNDDILNYLSVLEPEFTMTNTIQFTNNNIINIILSEKQAVAKAKGIPFHLDIAPCNLLFLDIVASCSLFSNLLDNAIEAAEQCMENSYIDLKLAQFNKHYVLLQIENPFVFVASTSQGLLTTKNDSSVHGYGLKQIRSIVESQGGIFTYEHKNNIFRVTVMLKSNS